MVSNQKSASVSVRLSMTIRPYNFCAGPAAIPEPVLRKAQEEMLDWQGRGISVMEVSHRSEEFVALAEAAEQKLRRLLNIPDDYAVLFCHGSATHQFAMIPMNLLPPNGVADYLNTGIWSDKAVNEARKFGQVNEIKALQMQDGLFQVTDSMTWGVRSDSAYFHYCPNETIGGVEIQGLPALGYKALVADMSSCILSKPVNVRDYGLIYAGAQKNIGPAGMTIVIIRRDLMGRASPKIPSLFDYKLLADNASMYNTPPTWAWYLADLVFDWIRDQGGVAAMAERNQEKSQLLYQFIDNNDFYDNPISLPWRSRMNIPFRLHDEKLNGEFLKQSQAAGLLALAGHRSVGGMRASLYNAMPVDGVKALIAFMSDFARRYG